MKKSWEVMNAASTDHRDKKGVGREALHEPLTVDRYAGRCDVADGVRRPTEPSGRD